ncbi:hypothetical protein BJV74DRAFT_815551 [Russula compacta]|nr:hypothetical protein BJV74DRAFT_815551 [Russula compacta]
MPKVVSRSAVSTSADGTPRSPRLHVTDCICGEFILVIDAALSSLPRRQTDGAVIVRSQDKDGVKARAFKLNAQPCEPILIERSRGGHERQYRFQCPRCTLPVAYQPNPPQRQPGHSWQIPSDAFDGEESVITTNKTTRTNTVRD